MQNSNRTLLVIKVGTELEENGIYKKDSRKIIKSGGIPCKDSIAGECLHFFLNNL
jgi:hypothetical protein